jgi:flagellar hook-associated protein FlgK
MHLGFDFIIYEDLLMNSIGSIVNQGLIGLQSSQASIARSTQQIVEAGTTQRDNPARNDLVEPLINIKAQTRVFNASAKVVEVANDTIGTLLNIKA